MKEVTKNNSAANLDASGIDFTQIGMLLEGTDFTNAKLNGADFSGMVLNGVKFSGADLTGAIFDDAELNRLTMFENATLKGASFQGAKVLDVRFTNSDLSGSSFKDATLGAAQFKNCKFIEVDMTNSSPSGVHQASFINTPISIKSDGAVLDFWISEMNQSESDLIFDNAVELSLRLSNVRASNLKINNIRRELNVDISNTILTSFRLSDLSFTPNLRGSNLTVETLVFDSINGLDTTMFAYFKTSGVREASFSNIQDPLRLYNLDVEKLASSICEHRRHRLSDME